MDWVRSCIPIKNKSTFTLEPLKLFPTVFPYRWTMCGLRSLKLVRSYEGLHWTTIILEELLYISIFYTDVSLKSTTLEDVLHTFFVKVFTSTNPNTWVSPSFSYLSLKQIWKLFWGLKYKPRIIMQVSSSFPKIWYDCSYGLLLHGWKEKTVHPLVHKLPHKFWFSSDSPDSV